ncbi:AAA family ATPase [Lachnospiraceae bacterium ASD3451]|uniref:DUF234 domain-containing protein n=1 Tax=Diplocloster agilis TaxID=2850323 RepID=UPI001E10F448|nr:DUF234 domain-containing protein [Diplocloster agilis]MBU9743528.1 AAA family ATPase [Diplocloster agilis]
MQKFVDREDELRTLEKQYEKKESSLVVLYGRRRVGKTSLCIEFMKGKNALYFLATEESEVQNRNQFKNLVADYLEDALLKNAVVDEWEIIFQTIVKTKTGRKKVLILDEFQYLGKANPAFPSIFQKIWEKVLKQENVMVILCGSLIHMMEEQTLNYGSPLYGRRTAQIKLKQIPFRYYGEFYPERGEKELIPLYSITGGVPKYVEVFESNDNIYEAIREHIVNTSSFLYDEPNFLLQKEVSEVGSYFSIIKTIAAGNQKLSKIAGSLEIAQSKITRYLKTLMDLDILYRDVPVTEKSPDKSKKGLYRLRDNFLLFWFKFIFPNMGYIESGHSELVMNKIEQNFIDSHVSFVYEDICREKIWQLSAGGCWPFQAQNVGRWWNNKDAKIDVVATDEEGGNIIFGECKYWKGPVGVNVLEMLMQKAEMVEWKGPERKEYYVLFSVNGFTPELEAQAARQKNVMLLS